MTAFTAGHFELEGSNSSREGQDSSLSMEESAEMPSFSQTVSKSEPVVLQKPTFESLAPPTADKAELQPLLQN